MVKIPKPPNFDEIKKRGGKSENIVDRVAKTASPNNLDSEREDKILEKWVESTKPEKATRFQPSKRKSPAKSNNKLIDYFLIFKEVELNGYRIDSIIRHPDGKWELIEVKTDSGLGLGVVGHLLTKRAHFEKIFRVKSRNVEMKILTDGISESLQTSIEEVNNLYNVNIRIDQVQI